MKKIEVMFADTNGFWESHAVEVPDEIAQSESQDAFLTWVYHTPEGKSFQESWQGDCMAVFVLSFSWDGDDPEWDGDDLDDPNDPEDDADETD